MQLNHQITKSLFIEKFFGVYLCRRPACVFFVNDFYGSHISIQFWENNFSIFDLNQ